ncbi:acetyltransferase [Lacticaseibacillus paracasei subsp. paracasei Lpp126]|uniref:Acetyltransferase n=1 Tax=Lacticaseibacillus paracasei subsp. paracasei Lpp126 TaxID=1256206 RepID=S2RTU8_LACPA|nr:acetyltransferase [Lacticaseibacillus paracasei subsp. paracasei Lpp126]
MITYLDRGNTLEVISLDSLRANQGIGSALLQS